MKTSVAKKNRFPATSCHPCSWSSGAFADTRYERGTHQMGAMTNTKAVTAAMTGPLRGLSEPTANQMTTGTIHTMWCTQVIGETMSSVAAHTRSPSILDDRR
jgi:hypothetical protein